jgi:hypothetical protein
MQYFTSKLRGLARKGRVSLASGSTISITLLAQCGPWCDSEYPFQITCRLKYKANSRNCNLLHLVHCPWWTNSACALCILIATNICVLGLQKTTKTCSLFCSIGASGNFGFSNEAILVPVMLYTIFKTCMSNFKAICVDFSQISSLWILKQ